jgi:uncharacterized membrane protein YhaH (DUF805 family)
MIGGMIENRPPPPLWQVIAAWTVWTVIVVLVWVPVLTTLWRRLRHDRGRLDSGRPAPAGIWILFAVLSAPMLIPPMVMMVQEPAFGAIISSAVGACFVWGIVRLVNRHHAKRPPDAP